MSSVLTVRGRTFQSTVLSHLLNWASTSMEKSLNQPTLPHAIIVLNATDTSVDTEVWDTDHATQALLSSVANAIDENIKFREYADYWMSQGRQIHTMKDLLECYYSSVTVIRVPTKGRYMLIDEQVTKLREQIAKTCEKSQYEKRRARMLSNSNELNVYLQSAFDHFANNLEAPFNFIEIAMKNSPIPSNFGGNILKLAVAVSHQEPRLTGPEIFRELSIMVASCIMLDCERNGRLGTEILLGFGVSKCVADIFRTRETASGKIFHESLRLCPGRFLSTFRSVRVRESKRSMCQLC